MNPQDVLHFWFEEATPAQHFGNDAGFDAMIRERFAELHAEAARAEFSNWRASPDGRLAEIIVLDQFSRNLFRDDARAFATDGMALVLAQEALRAGADLDMPAVHRVFLYMPFMHAESRAIHLDAERLFRQSGLEDNYRYELKHKAIIDRFGRYPHRNALLGRESTPDELDFLQQRGSSF